jgi:ABC-type multidrug transport system ATPase subunit
MKNIIQINNLSFGYQKNNPILKNININVPKGSIYGFIGPNGAGKSTTMRLISGIESSNQEVLIFNESIKSQIPNIFHKIGALVESPTLYYHLSGEDNLKYIAISRGLSFDKIDPVLELVDLLHAKKVKVKRYSLGMKQRLAIAMSIIHEPELLLLDEPVNGLDPTGMIEIRELLIKINKEKNTTIFISSHLLSEIEKMCTHIGIIAKGEIKFEGTIQELSNKFMSYQIEIQTDINEAVLQKLNSNHIDFEVNDHKLIFKVNGKNEIPLLIKKMVQLDIPIYETKKNGGLEEWFLQITN